MSKIKFGTDGWRAIIADEFTFENVRCIAFAIAKYIKDKKLSSCGIVIGYDTRFLSEKFAHSAGEVLSENSIPVFLTQRDTPTPVVAFSVISKKTAGAIMFTASHNPPEWGGLKFIPEYGGPALPDITEEIERNIADCGLRIRGTRAKLGSCGLKTKKITTFDPRENYFKKLKSLINFSAIKRANLKIAYDPMYGTGRDYLDKILKDYCKTEVIHNYLNPLFGGRLPDPSEKNLVELKQKVLKENLDIGVSTDGDADRFGIIDKNGDYFTPNQIITLLFYHLVKNRGYRVGKVARTVATTSALDKLARKYNIEVIETPVGFKYIGEVMRKTPTIIGGEESGGLSILGHIPEKDGILACLLVLEMISTEKKSIKNIYHEVQKIIGPLWNNRIDIYISSEKKLKVLKRLRENPLRKIAGEKVMQVVNTDGFKFYLADESWILVRPSGTEPLIRVYSEATSQNKIKKLEEEIKIILR